MTRNERFPNLFMVGAPKCGTSSMVYWLGQHPDIFTPVWKEPGYFGADLTTRTERQSKASYLELFANWNSERYGLDATTLYLSSRSAALEIRDCSPAAVILVMVRNPIDAVYSMYLQNRFNGVEPLPSFERSLGAEADRAKQGSPPARGHLERLLYSKLYSYTDNISHYQWVFGTERVRVIVFDDIVKDPRATLDDTFQFLGVDASVTLSLNAQNTAKRAIFPWLSHFASGPPRWMGQFAQSFLSREARFRIRKAVLRFNARAAESPPMQPETRKLLIERFSPEIARLSNLLGRDLSHWVKEPA
jgi:hypothetical protein